MQGKSCGLTKRHKVQFRHRQAASGPHQGGRNRGRRRECGESNDTGENRRCGLHRRQHGLTALRSSLAPIKLQIGQTHHGLGCGAIPERGRQAALEDTERIIEVIDGADMVFITCAWARYRHRGGAGRRKPGDRTRRPHRGRRTKPFNFEGKKRGRTRTRDHRAERSR